MAFQIVANPATVRRADAPSWKLGIGISVAAHLVIGTALAFGLQRSSPPEPVSLNTAMAVEILPMPSAPANPAHETPPEPQEPQDRPDQLMPKPDTPPVPQIPQVKADVTLPTEAPPPPKRAAPPPPPPPAAQAAPAKAAAAPVQGTPTQGASTVEQNYNAQILAKLESRKRYPSEARQGRVEDVIHVRIVIDRNGHVTTSEITRSRHYAVLDEAVKDLIRRVDPFPKMPKAISGDNYIVTVPIDFFMQHRR
ncbi:TonB family protein [Sphingobium sp. H39-3-25]|uniref:energy transducer TonB n=1 Tax=Sphingobium arseniciresistens TaxID=3030834 RepID=UPI0023B8D9D1|nr:TonB family protein [Sphingobium arseniciresistens]